MNMKVGWMRLLAAVRPNYGLLFLLLPSLALAQAPKTVLDCENDLDDAKNAYYQGNLKAVQDKIEKSCLQAGMYSRPKMVEGYRLLTESFLFRNEDSRAQISFENLLRYNPLFEVDSTDPNASYDLIHLSRTYRRKPVISIYGSAGINYSRVNTLQRYGASNTVTSTSDYSQITIGWNANLGFEIPVYKNYDFLMEANFSNRKYARLDSLYIVTDKNNALENATSAFAFGSMQFTEVQYWLDVPIMGRYNHYWRKNIIPYAYAGVAPNFLLRSALRGINRRNVDDGRGGGQVVGNEKEVIIITRHVAKDANGNKDEYLSTDNSLRNMFNISLVGGVGCKFRVERNFMFLDIRYNRFLLNSVDVDNRYAQKELLYKYAYVDNDYRMDNVSISFGFMRSFYKPRKKREYDPFLAAKAFDKAQKQKEREAQKNGETIRGTNTQETQRNVKEDAEEAKRKEKERKNFIDDVRAGRRTVNSIND